MTPPGAKNPGVDETESPESVGDGSGEETGVWAGFEKTVEMTVEKMVTVSTLPSDGEGDKAGSWESGGTKLANGSREDWSIERVGKGLEDEVENGSTEGDGLL